MATTARGRLAMRRDQRSDAPSVGSRRGSDQRSRLSPSIASSAGVTNIAEITLSKVATMTAIATERTATPGSSSEETTIATISAHPAGRTARAVASPVLCAAATASPPGSLSRKRETTSSE